MWRPWTAFTASSQHGLDLERIAPARMVASFVALNDNGSVKETSVAEEHEGSSDPLHRADDERWRRSARALGLQCVDEDGGRVPWKRATRATAMRGRIGGRDVRATCGLRRSTDGVTVTRVSLTRSLLLGLKAQAYLGVERGGVGVMGVSVGATRPLRFDFTAIEAPRVGRMFESQTGKALVALLRSLGSYGWIELGDSAIRAQSEFRTDRPEGYAELIAAIARVADLAETARDELEATDWEQTLLARLETTCAELGLDIDRRAFAASGVVRGARVSVSLDATAQYTLLGVVRPAHPLPKGARVARRAGIAAWLRWVMGLDRATGNPRFDKLFCVTGALRGRLPPPVVESLLAVARAGEVTVDERGVVARIPLLDGDVGELAAAIVRIAEGLGSEMEASPYR